MTANFIWTRQIFDFEVFPVKSFELYDCVNITWDLANYST